MSEHTGLEFAPQSPRSQNSPSMPPLVLFIISMKATSSPGSSLVWRVTRDEDPGEIQKKLQDSWSVVACAITDIVCC